MNETWWIGALAPSTSRTLDLGPQHPTRAGLVRLDVTIAGDIITHAEIQPGYLHRSAEKLFEVRDYRQVLMLADRHDWHSPFTGELLIALACEQVWGLIPPPRATLLRTLLAEVSRVMSHLAFLAWVPHHAQDAPEAARLRDAREGGRRLMLQLTGNRLHPMLNRLGGLATDAAEAWLSELAQWLSEVDRLSMRPQVDELDLPDGLGSLSAADVDSLGVSGPAARAAGLQRDLRQRPGYLDYDRLTWTRTGDGGTGASDVVGRFRQWADEVQQSVDLARQCLELLPRCEGPVNQKLAKIIKLPDAEARFSIEAPHGVAGVHLVSRGGTTPWRLKLRTPTFSNVMALQKALSGTRVEYADAVIASLGWTIGDLDK